MRKIIFLLLIATISIFADIAVSVAAQDQTDVSSAGMSSRSFVAWTDTRSGTGNKHIYGNIIDTDGSLISSEFPVCVADDQQYDVAVTAGQKFMAIWVDERTTDEWDIWGQHVNIDATLSGLNFQVTTNNTQKSKPSADNLDNDIMVVFEEAMTNSTIRGQKLTWGGSSYSPSGSVFSISDGATDAYAPDVSASDTDYLVAWSDLDNKRIFARKVTAAGAATGTAQIVADYSAGAYSPGHPSVAWDGTQWLVVWDIYISGNEMDVYGRYIDASGAPTGSSFGIATGAGPQNESYPDLDFDGIGFLVVFQDTRDVLANIYGRRITGVTLGGEVTISPGSYNQNKPSIDWNGTAYDIFWQDYRGTYNWDIYSKREDQTPWNGPSVSPITPPDLGASSCSRQNAVMELTDSDGINTSTIQFTANGVSYDIADSELSYSSDQLTFTPSAAWPQNIWIECCINAVEDMTGLGILNPVCWSFMIDQTDPIFGVAIPADEESTGAGAVPISIGVTDAGCGVSTDNMAFQIEGTWFVYGTSSAVSWDGTSMHFDPTEEGIAFEPFDTIDVCARVRDRAEYCTENEITTCWNFYTTGTKIYGNVHLAGVSDHSGVTVEARYGDSLWADITDIDGDYSIPGVLEVDGINVTAYKEGYSDSTVTVNMGEGGFGLANFTLYPIVTLYFSDFEASDGDLELRNYDYYNDWEWGEPTSGPGSAHSGSKCWATKLNTDYSDSSQSRLVLGPIDLPEFSAPKIMWWQWYRFQAPTSSGWPRVYSWHDGGNVKLWRSLTDSTFLVPDKDYDTTMSTYNRFVGFQRAYADDDNGDFWHRVTVDLSTWAGQTVYISWDFGSSSRNAESGWFIDDVTVGYTDFTGVYNNIPKPESRGISVFPNPFNSICAIVAEDDVEIYDVSGRLVRCIETSNDGKNDYQVWDGTDFSGESLPSGVYFAKLKGNEKSSARIIYMK
ncbi:T9SS type A sorting domain-containing protein [bacterium]|nr:T9SS type A sorting domain-containing protein [bacterium]